MRVVLDTSVLVAAFRSRRGASYRLLELVEESRIEMVATPALFLEYEDVLSRPDQRLHTGLSLRDVDTLMLNLATLITPIQVHFQWRPQLMDAGDEMVLEAAINGGVGSLITHNVKHLGPAMTQFDLRIITAGQAMRELSL